MKNKRMYSIIIFFLVLIILGGCSAPTIAPDQVVNEYWEYFKEGNIEEVRKRIHPEREGDIGAFDPDITEIEDEFVRTLIEYIDLETQGTEIDNEYGIATVNINLFKPNFQQVFTGFLEEALGIVLSLEFGGASQEIIDKRIEEILVEQLEKAEKVSHQEEVILSLHDSEWKIYSFHLDSLESRINDLQSEFDL
ncbi:hypothetical protein [Natronospora cellulosivora (SeqCode)]